MLLQPYYFLRGSTCDKMWKWYKGRALKEYKMRGAIFEWPQMETVQLLIAIYRFTKSSWSVMRLRSIYIQVNTKKWNQIKNTRTILLFNNNNSHFWFIKFLWHRRHRPTIRTSTENNATRPISNNNLQIYSYRRTHTQRHNLSWVLTIARTVSYILHISLCYRGWAKISTVYLGLRHKTLFKT